MTKEELVRFKKGDEIQKQIDRLQAEISKTNRDFKYIVDPEFNHPPKDISDCTLSVMLNHEVKMLTLDNNQFAACVLLVQKYRNDKIKELEKQFKSV